MYDPLAPASSSGRPASQRSISCTLPDTFAYLIDMYCERLQIKRTDLMREALVEYMASKGVTIP